MINWPTILAHTSDLSPICKLHPAQTFYWNTACLTQSSFLVYAEKLSNQVNPHTIWVLSTCGGCLLGKSTQHSFKTDSPICCSKPFAPMHMDLAGLICTNSIQGSFYHYIIVDDHLHFKWVFFLQTKDQAFDKFKTFHAFILTQIWYHTQSYTFWLEGGGKFMSTEFKRFMESNGIEHQLTAPHTPQQNRVAERTNCTIAGVATALLQLARMPNRFWESTISTAVHVRNHTPSHINNYVCLSTWKTFQPGPWSFIPTCLWMPCILPYHKNSNQIQSHFWTLDFCRLWRFPKAYKLWDPKGQKFVITIDIIFEETTFPLCTETARPVQSIPLWEFPPKPAEYVDVTLPESDDEDNNIPLTIPSAQPSVQTDAPPQQQMTNLLDQTPVSPVQELWRLTWLTWDIHSADPTNVNPDHEWLQQGSTPWVPGIWTNMTKAFLAATNVTSAEDPSTYEHAMCTAEAHLWQKAMTKEITALHDNGTWVLVDLPPGRKTVKNWWVYITKPDTSGKDSDQAHLVATGFTQEAVVDYEETFTPVAWLDSVGHICIHIYAKRSIQIYILIFSFIFLSEVVCFTICLYIQIFVYFSEFFSFYRSYKNCVNTWHGTSNLLPLRHHVPAHHAESKSKGRLWHHKQLQGIYGWNHYTNSLSPQCLTIHWGVLFFRIPLLI